MKVRFTSQNVNRMLYTVASPGHGLGDEATKYLLNALHTGNDIGNGTRYIGMGGRMDVQFGPRGARKAVAYLSGMGFELGVWERLEKISEESELPYARLKLESATELTSRALADLGVDEYTRWHDLGELYAQKVNR